MTQKKNTGKSIGFSIKNMAMSVDPFRDFYVYSCGNWLKKAEIPSDKSQISSFSQLYDSNMLVLKEIVESCFKKGAGSSSVIESKVGSFYASYMDTATLEKLKFNPINPILKEIRDMRDKKELPEMLAKLSRIGVQAFFNIYVTADIKDSSRYALYTWQGGISLPDRDYYLKKMFSGIRKDYTKHVEKVFALYGANSTFAARDAHAVLDIETALAKSSRSRVELRDDLKNYNKMTPKQISSRYKGIGLLDFYKGIGARHISYVVIEQPEFFDKLAKLIDSTSINDIKAYLTFAVLHSYSGLMHKSMYNEYFDFFGKRIMGQKAPRPRWKRGISLIDSMIGEALGELYVKRNFDAETRKKAEQLVSDIRASFKERLGNVSWMTPQTKKRALDKLNAITQKIGYPEKFRDYSKLVIKSNDALGNFQRSYAFELDRDISRIGKKVDKKEWGMTPPTVNAYYNPSMNEIVFPAGIFQPPFFDPNMDDAVNYAAIGGVIGHEMTHGFDDQGSRYDKYGNLKKWWSEKDTKNFKKRADKVAELYGTLEIMPNLKLNGKLTLGENMADLGGIHIAYDALQKSLARDPSKRKRIGGFTPEQRFFISWAQLWKGKTQPEEQKRLAIIDPHSPMKVRGVMPPLTHHKFQETFKEKSKQKVPKNAYNDISPW